jgi:hypothetical protein
MTSVLVVLVYPGDPAQVATGQSPQHYDLSLKFLTKFRVKFCVLLLVVYPKRFGIVLYSYCDLPNSVF